MIFYKKIVNNSISKLMGEKLMGEKFKYNLYLNFFYSLLI